MYLHKIKPNKRGQAGTGLVILIFILLFAIMIIGIILAFGGALTQWLFNNIVGPIGGLTSSSDINGTGINSSQIASYTIGPINSIVQSFTWLGGVIYVLLLICAIAFPLAMRIYPHRILIGFFFLCMIILILGSIFLSNIYEGFYNGTDEIAMLLKSQTLLSFMILNSPPIMTIIGFLSGIFMFSGKQQEGGGQ